MHTLAEMHGTFDDAARIVIHPLNVDRTATSVQALTLDRQITGWR